jgi:hypothetical protein
MLRAPVLSIRTVGLFVGMLALLVATITLPGGAGAQTEPLVVIKGVRGTLSDGGSFAGRIIEPKVTYVAATDTFKMSGILAGTVTKANGDTDTVRKEFTTNLRLSQGGVSKQVRSCEILDLDIGRIKLDLLGLVVNIAPIHINVTAVPGAGNLLGNLLCAVAGLLDDLNGPDLADFLNGLLTRLFRV